MIGSGTRSAFLGAALVLFTAAAWAQSAGEVDISEELETGIIATPAQRARAYDKEGNWARLKEVSERWAREFPGESAAWQYLGKALQKLGEDGPAARAYSRAWDLSDQKNPHMMESAGDLYSRAEEHDKAEAAYRAALSVQPGEPRLWWKLTDAVLARRGESWRQDAIDALRHVLAFEEYKDSHKRWRQYAEILDQTGAPLDEQYLAYRQTARTHPGDIAAWERLYEIESARENHEEAGKIARRLLKLNPGNALANLHYGVLEIRSGSREKARRYLDAALADPTLSPRRRSRVHLALGDLHRDPAKSLSYYQQAAADDPANVEAWEKAIVILRAQGRRREADALYDRLLEIEAKIKDSEPIQPGDAAPLTGLGKN